MPTSHDNPIHYTIVYFILCILCMARTRIINWIELALRASDGVDMGAGMW